MCPAPSLRAPCLRTWEFERPKPDWLLIYKIDDDDLYLVCTGTHSDLF
ncbi:MAG: type II toxin-antitoxin system YafQ family toxin [Terriglobia bacterium]